MWLLEANGRTDRQISEWFRTGLAERVEHSSHIAHGLGLNCGKIMIKSSAKYSMLIGECYISEMELQVDTTDHGASNFNVNKIRK